jgi:Uma2 family endonuclease
MTGAKKPHIIIGSNLVRLLGNHLLNTPCLVLSSDIKVRLEEANCYYYPDVAVTCDERDTGSTEDFILYPSLVVEVLSPSTAAFDRGNKFADYQTASSLQEYVLITPSEIKIECFRVNAEGNWVSQTYREGDELELMSIDFRCPIAQVYHKVPGIIL